MPSLFKRIRARFGISAPKVAVRTHVGWYWRWLGILAALAVIVVIAAGFYDAGRRFAGFDSRRAREEISRLRASLAKLEDEREHLRAITDASESRLKIEQSAQAQLEVQAKALEDENTRLKEDLAFFENLTPSTSRLSIHRFRVEADVLPGEYRYRLLVLRGVRRNREFQGSLQLVISLRQGGRDATISIPDQGSANASAYALRFKYFQRVEGTFRLPRNARLIRAQARVLVKGSIQARADQRFNPPLGGKEG